jgi:hypothetical protein
MNMDARLLSICIGAIALAVTGFYYGFKFCQKRNYLIGVEWFALAISSTNFMVYELTHSHITYLGVLFLDTFSRGFGVPIVTVAGLMVLTHGFRPTIRLDVLLFIATAIATLIVLMDQFAPILAIFLLAMWTVFTIFLFYFAYRLWEYGENLHAFGVLLAAILNQTIAYMYDFYKIPGDETNIILNFYTIALFTWAYLTVQLYYSYCALERAINAAKEGDMNRAHQS